MQEKLSTIMIVFKNVAFKCDPILSGLTFEMYTACFTWFAFSIKVADPVRFWPNPDPAFSENLKPDLLPQHCLMCTLLHHDKEKIVDSVLMVGYIWHDDGGVSDHYNHYNHRPAHYEPPPPPNHTPTIWCRSIQYSMGPKGRLKLLHLL